MRPSSLLLALVPAASAGLLSVVAAEPLAPITVVHRHLPHHAEPPTPALDACQPEWTPRLTIHFDASAAAGGLPVVSRVEQLRPDDEPLIVGGDGTGWYQVALEGSESFTSVKGCYHNRLAGGATQEVFTLHTTTPAAPAAADDASAPGSPPAVYHLDYALGGIARDGACPTSDPRVHPDAARARNPHKPALVVKLASADRPTPLILGAPPPVDATTGMPVEPVPEKSLIQKYWMYAAIPLVLMLVLPEPAADAPAAK